mgnify:CR=1 FL=1
MQSLLKNIKIRKAEKVLLILYLIAFFIKVFALSLHNLIFTVISCVVALFYNLGSWYFLGLPYNKFTTIIISIILGMVFSLAFVTILFNIQHWEGAKTFFYLSEAVLIITIFIIFFNREISDAMKSLLILRSIVLFGLSLLAIFL